MKISKHSLKAITIAATNENHAERKIKSSQPKHRPLPHDRIDNLTDQDDRTHITQSPGNRIQQLDSFDFGYLPTSDKLSLMKK